MFLKKTKHVYFAALMLACFLCTHTKKVGIIAPWWGSVLSTDVSTFNRNNGNDPIFALRHELLQRGDVLFEIHNTQDIVNADLVLWFDLSAQIAPWLTMKDPKNQVLFTWEPPVTSPLSHDLNLHKYFRAVYTWNDALVAKKPSKYKQFCYPRLKQPITDIVPFDQKKEMAMMYTNMTQHHNQPGELKTERIKAVKFFENCIPTQFDLYGRGWNKSQFPSFVSAPIDKPGILKNYKFFICYENTGNVPGYISEKIFDCFHAGCVPVYLGAPNIEQYIPGSCFVHARDFMTTNNINYPALLSHLRCMSKEEYDTYLVAASQYCRSSQAQCFSIEHFVAIVVNEIANV